MDSEWRVLRTERVAELEARVTQLEEALRRIAGTEPPYRDAREVAREALASTKPDAIRNEGGNPHG